jgi:membrane dipeptidase
MQNITIELVKRGYTEEEITKIWGGNIMRVMREVQQNRII